MEDREDTENKNKQEILEEERNPNKVCSPVMYEHSHALQDMLGNAEENTIANNNNNEENGKIEKNWTKDREKAVRNWQTDIEKTSFIYNEVLMDRLWWMNFILIGTLLLSVISAFFEALAVVLAFLNVKWIGIGFNIAILIFTGAAAVMTGMIKILGIDSDIQILSRYIEKLDNAWFPFEIELGLPADRRADAIDFINRADGQYLSLMQQSPSITPNDYTQANQNYQQRLFNNYMWSRKFKKHMKDELEEIVV